jgi:hypothetical protein
LRPTTKNVARAEYRFKTSSRCPVYGPGPSSNVRARHLLLTQSAGLGAAAEDEADEVDEVEADEVEDEARDCGGAPPAARGEDDDKGAIGERDGAGDRGGGAATVRCTTRSFAEIGRQAVTSTPMINTQRITLVITLG